MDEFRQRTSDHSSTEPNIKIENLPLKDWSNDEKTLLLERFKELIEVTVIDCVIVKHASRGGIL